ncbi:alanine/ornithine racemase family PLP-dependent enzyme [Thermosipho ferrireducens]|uniref:Alanine/ornithine racemase family PLP-dependent enzyme n=1 Tax=Thermosipho ferrireducens TaxID=2571116 RepID=A0ABX7S7N4_9BACT|nr:alanine/ornithine racemase family PLP-dependent enzyme [Thermosipho ferrireducens]QTA37820.1 alanine/ornithine racemase family PLP-dependent enzyme [Thermosipho ferrireducens]
MSFPRLIINLEKIFQNAYTIAKICHEKHIELVAVTKLILGNPEIARILKEAGVDKIGDSRLKNIEKMKKNGVPGPFQLLRIPMLSELEKAVALVDEILVSQPEIARAVDTIAEKYDKNIQIIYMIDVGDLREGVWYEEAALEIQRVDSMLKKATLRGIGTNLGCFGGVIPSEENTKILAQIKNELENMLNKKLVISGGNTASLRLLENNITFEGDTQFRIGEAIILGTDATNHRNIPYLSQDTVILEAEVIEVDYKPSVPVGEIGHDAMGRIPHFEDKGWRKRIILAIGEQDIDPSGLKPFDKKLNILHASSDHTLIDITDSETSYNIGDIVKFRLSYGCALRAFTSPYVGKIFT